MGNEYSKTEWYAVYNRVMAVAAEYEKRRDLVAKMEQFSLTTEQLRIDGQSPYSVVAALLNGELSR